MAIIPQKLQRKRQVTVFLFFNIPLHCLYQFLKIIYVTLTVFCAFLKVKSPCLYLDPYQNENQKKITKFPRNSGERGTLAIIQFCGISILWCHRFFKNYIWKFIYVSTSISWWNQNILIWFCLEMSAFKRWLTFCKNWREKAEEHNSVLEF